MLRYSVFGFVCVVVKLLFRCSSSVVFCDNFCSENALSNTYSDLPDADDQTTNTQEYGIGGHSKSLHCCAKNYQYISWFKEGVPYPWKEDISNFVIDANSENQSIRVRSLSREDGGTYSCVISTPNSRSVVRQISLKVFDSGYSGIPMHTFVEARNLAVHVGSRLRLYCEAFVGKIDLPDAQNKISWFKLDANDTLASLSNDSRWQLKKIVKDDGLTLGLYLVTDEVKNTDLGEYVCSVSNAADQITRVYTKLVDADATSLIVLFCMIGVPLLVVFGVVAYFVYRKYVYEIRACLRQYTAFETYDDSKDYDYDIFILYEAKEMDFVKTTLIPTLNNVDEFALSLQLFRNDTDAADMECKAKIAASRTLLLVLSNPCRDQDEKRFFQKLRLASRLHSKVVCLLKQESDTKNLRDTELRKFTNRLTLVQVPANHTEDWRKLWHLLKLHLPTRTKRSVFTSINSKRYSTVHDKHLEGLCIL